MSSKLKRALSDGLTDERKQRKGIRHNKRQEQHTSDETDDKAPLKLTIKIGGQTLGEKSVIKSSIRSQNSVSTNQSIDTQSVEEPDLSISFEDEEVVDYGLEEEEEEEEVVADEDTEEPDEEEEWLDALEEGRLHEVDDELKKIRDPKLMTARQRALLENKSLKGRSESIKTIGSQELDKTMSEEMIERKLLKDRRRRQQAEEKKEKDKKQTIDRLLRKRQELVQKVKKKKKTDAPKVTYKSCADGIFICLPVGMPLEQIMATKKAAPNRRQSTDIERIKCFRNGCENEKKYLCSKSKQFVCSLRCYKEVEKNTDS